MTDYEIYALTSYKDGVQEDLRPVKRARMDDLNKDKLREYIEKAKMEKPNFSSFSDEKIMKLCGIIENDEGTIYPTLAGVLLFADYPQAFFPQLFVACVVIPGKEVGDLGEMGQRFDDNKRIEGTIEEMLENTLSFIRKNMSYKVIISSTTGKREDLPEYPILALKEAIANALVHRDYSVSREGTYIQIRMFDDRIEIQNPGALYGNNRLEKLGTDTIVETRNKNIIRILEEMGNIIENRHTGIPTMKKEMKKMNLPEPKFEEIRGDFKVTFYNSEIDVITQGDQGITQGDQGITQGEGHINMRFSNYDRILKYCMEAKTISEISNYLGYKSSKHVKKYYINPLIDCQKIALTIPKKPTSQNQKYITIK
jgi:ATP-dependent DNA helicase RecG